MCVGMRFTGYHDFHTPYSVMCWEAVFICQVFRCSSLMQTHLENGVQNWHCLGLALQSYKRVLGKQMEQLVLRQFKKSEKSGSLQLLSCSWPRLGSGPDRPDFSLCSLTVCRSEHIALLILAQSDIVHLLLSVYL